MELLKRACSILKPPKYSVICDLPSINQTIKLEEAFLSHVQRYRQFLPCATEAGGQLFGLIESNQVKVNCASGPYDGDERLRHHYRSSSVAAQKAINKKSDEGLLYLGEWHTHAENQPNASQMDFDAMQKLMRNSRLNCNLLLLIIVGRESGLSGISVYTFNGGDMHQWSLSKTFD